MFERLLQVKSAFLRTPVLIKMMVMVALMLTLANHSNAQTQTTPTTDEAIAQMVKDAKTTPAVGASATKSRVSPFSTVAKPKAQGAGSDNPGYIFLRGYVLHISRSNGDPAVINSDAVGNITSVDDFDYGVEGAFKVEAGWNATNNWGFRVGYFYTTQTADENRTATAAAPFIISPRPLNVTFTGAAAAGTAATFRERFRLHVIDVEGTYKWHSSNSSLVVSAGVRIAPSRQTYNANDIFVTTPEALTYTQKRTGVGPTFGLDWRHRIGSSNFWWTGAGRIAVLFGKIKETSTFASGTFIQTATRDRSRTNWVLEGETGVEWAKKFGSNNEFW